MATNRKQRERIALALGPAAADKVTPQLITDIMVAGDPDDVLSILSAVLLPHEAEAVLGGVCRAAGVAPAGYAS